MTTSACIRNVRVTLSEVVSEIHVGTGLGGCQILVTPLAQTNARWDNALKQVPLSTQE